jgi:hypothetical protein
LIRAVPRRQDRVDSSLNKRFPACGGFFFSLATFKLRSHLNSPIMAPSDRSKTPSASSPRPIPRGGKPFHEIFQLPREDQHDVDPAWFERRKQSPVQNNDPSLRDWLAKQVDALKTFHDGHITAEEAALSMTHPVSTSPVPDLGGYSDQILAVCNLWQVIIPALMEWPSNRVPDLFTLLDAIGQAPGAPHKGEADDGDGDKLTWATFPYFGFSWYERTSADFEAGQICQRYSDAALLASARKVYLKLKDMEARLVAAHVMSLNYRMIHRIIWTLEKEIDQIDEIVAGDEATAFEQIKLDWHIPAVEFMFEHNERALYDKVVTKELEAWTKGQLAALPRQHQTGAERWSFWKKRLEELSQGDASDEVRAAAKASLECMSQR